MLLRDKHIFVVEDNMKNRVVTQVALVAQGARVTFERFGKDTIHVLQRVVPVHVILLDLMLAEGVSGYDVFEQIRARPEFADVPIVAVSASEPAIAIPKTRDMGFSGFIAKPIDSDMFPRQIARIINGRPVWQSGLGNFDISDGEIDDGWG